MRRIIPSGPGAAETRMRSLSVWWRSAASVRSIAGASVRTLMASTARAGDKPTATIVKIAAAQARIARKRRPPSSTPADPSSDNGRSGAPSVSGPRPVRTLVKFASISRPPCLSKKADAISPDCSKADQKEQESQSIARAKEGPGAKSQHDLPDMRAALPGHGRQPLAQARRCCRLADAPCPAAARAPQRSLRWPPCQRRNAPAALRRYA